MPEDSGSGVDSEQGETRVDAGGKIDLDSGAVADADGETDADDAGSALDALVPEVDAGPTCTPDTEVCNGKDDDCDGKSDESVSEAPIGMACSDGVQGVCATEGKRICFDGEIVCNSPTAPGTETCDGKDNDCDGQTDEGVTNKCGKCGEVPVEICDGVDNDCDGQTDEGVTNKCGKCGEVPVEICDGVDNDCDGQIDENVKNECGQCGSVPAENCATSADDDCDGQVNEGCCGNGSKDPGEQCDPTAPGYTVFNCTQQCTPSKVYANCVTDVPGTQGNCPANFVCGAFGNGDHPVVSDYCIPVAPCPVIPGVSWVMYGEACVQPCTTSSQCPVPVTYCYANPLGGAEPEAWCVK